VPVPETSVRPVGSVSVTVIAPVVATVPVLLTAMLKTPLVPAVKFPEWLFVMARCGTEEEFTVNVSVEESVPPMTSPELATVAVLLMVPVTVDASATTREIEVEVAGAIEVEFVQMTVWPLAEHDQPVPVPETKVIPAGRGSVTVVTPFVAPGPALVTAMV
jgi:hypothetical protein